MSDVFETGVSEDKGKLIQSEMEKIMGCSFKSMFIVGIVDEKKSPEITDKKGGAVVMMNGKYIEILQGIGAQLVMNPDLKAGFEMMLDSIKDYKPSKEIIKETRKINEKARDNYKKNGSEEIDDSQI